jgi:hypothetical protein
MSREGPPDQVRGQARCLPRVGGGLDNVMNLVKRAAIVGFPGGSAVLRWRFTGGEAMTWRRNGPMDARTAAVMLLMGTFTYSAWLTSIVFCSANDERPLLIAAAAFFPVGVVHGVGVWLGGW